MVQEAIEEMSLPKIDAQLDLIATATKIKEKVWELDYNISQMTHCMEDALEWAYWYSLSHFRQDFEQKIVSSYYLELVNDKQDLISL